MKSFQLLLTIGLVGLGSPLAASAAWTCEAKCKYYGGFAGNHELYQAVNAYDWEPSVAFNKLWGQCRGLSSAFPAEPELTSIATGEMATIGNSCREY